jgi:hypothetical protein
MTDEKKPNPLDLGDIDVTMGNNNDVGDIGHKIHVHVRQPIRQVNAEFAAWLLPQIEERKAVSIEWLSGDHEASAFAAQIERMLAARGIRTIENCATNSNYFLPGVTVHGEFIRVGARE